MKFSVKNLGPIKEGTIAFDKPLTVLVGPNSSGKSYVAYLLYGILRENFYLSGEYINDTELEDFLEKKEDDEKFYIAKFFRKYSDTIVDKIIDLIEDKLAVYFASNFIKPEVRIIDLKDFLDNTDGDKLFTYTGYLIGLDVISRKQYNAAVKEEMPEKYLNLLNDEDFIEAISSKELWRMISSGLLVYFFCGLPEHSIFFPAERLALSMLSGSVVENKSKELDQINKLLLKEDVDDQVILERLKKRNKQTPKYPLAINDHIYFINGLEHTRKNESPYASFAQEIETMLLKGTVAVDDFGAINFKPQESEQAIGIHVSSSLVKSLAAIVLYFKHKAEKGDTLIIDEPEVNLHPNNQRIVARILAKAVNLGFKLVISTHSDYLLRELNNLILLDSIYKNEESKEEILAAYTQKGYDETTKLSKEDIGVYYFTDNTIKELPVNQYGFEVDSIDKEVYELNDATDDFYAKLRELEA